VVDSDTACSGALLALSAGMVRSVVGALMLALTASPGGLFSGEVHGAGTIPPALERFLSTEQLPPQQYRALRRLSARSERLNASAWMEVWTEADANGFRFEVAAEGGSREIRSRVFMAALRSEREMWGGRSRGAINAENYRFQALGDEPTGLVSIGVKPLRKDIMLVNGAIFLRPEDGDLVRIEGTLSRTPSFWTRRVNIVRRYERIAGVRLPVALESTAHVLIAGKSTMTMTYEYESVNGNRVGSPVLASHGPAAPATP
jgi:hypothetical protein